MPSLGTRGLTQAGAAPVPCKDEEKGTGDTVPCARSHLVGTCPKPPVSTPDHVPLADAGAETPAGSAPHEKLLRQGYIQLGAWEPSPLEASLACMPPGTGSSPPVQARRLWPGTVRTGRTSQSLRRPENKQWKLIQESFMHICTPATVSRERAYKNVAFKPGPGVRGWTCPAPGFQVVKQISAALPPASGLPLCPWL